MTTDLLELPESLQAAYPFSHNFLETESGYRLHYVDEGEGQPFLFVHGNPTWSFAFRHLLLHFRSQHRVVACDHIGCGLSEKPQEFEYRLEQHIEHLEQLVLSLDLTDIRMLVHDWGGAIGLGVAGRHPERFKELVISNTAAFRSQQMPWLLRIAKTPHLGQLLIRGFNAFAGLTPILGAAKPARLDATAKEGLLYPYRDWFSRIATYRFVADIPLDPSHPSYSALTDVENGLEALRPLRTLLLWGEQDWVFTTHFLRRFLEFFPEAEARSYPDCGHLLMEEAPDRMIQAIEAYFP